MVRCTRRYLPDTAVIETCFETERGAVALIDFMPLSEDEEKVDVVRIVRGVRGEVAMRMELVLRFDYGRTVPWVRRRDYGLSAIAGPDAIELHTDAPLEGRDLRTYSSFTVGEGASVPFTLSYHRSHRAPHFVGDRNESLGATVEWWRQWTGICRFHCDNEPWRDAVRRSLITLKLLTFEPTGGIVAAPTTSLPESLGGARNWDYRYCWLRDSTLTLYALLNAGYRDEAAAWRQWLLRAAAGLPEQLHIMYGVAGERWLPEIELPCLPGYADSRPVRVGNAAVTQRQLDVYGEVMDAFHAARVSALAPLDEAWRLQKSLLTHLERVWREPDQGIWETRGPPRAFTHSRLMCWVAFDRALKSCETWRSKVPTQRWAELRDEIHADICAHGYDRRRNTFVQHYGGGALDASLLLLPQTGFLPLDDPRVAGTVDAVERELLVDGFVMRYATDEVEDGVGGRRRARFSRARSGSQTRTHSSVAWTMPRSCSTACSRCATTWVFFAEEYDPVARRLLGNFPQAFSHVGLVNTAFNLVAAHGPAQQRAECAAPPRDGARASKNSP